MCVSFGKNSFENCTDLQKVNLNNGEIFMIQSKADLKEYMEADRIHLGYKYKKPKIRDIVWRYEIYLRKSEYYNNVSGGGVSQNSRYIL